MEAGTLKTIAAEKAILSIDDLLTAQLWKPATCLGLLDAIEDRIEKAKSRTMLWQRVPESYDDLVKRLQDAREGLAPSGRTVLAQLMRVFAWCGEHGIELSALVPIQGTVL